MARLSSNTCNLLLLLFIAHSQAGTSTEEQTAQTEAANATSERCETQMGAYFAITHDWETVTKSHDYRDAEKFLHEFETCYSGALAKYSEKDLVVANGKIQIQVRIVPIRRERSTSRLIEFDDGTKVDLSTPVLSPYQRTSTTIHAVVTKWSDLGKYLRRPLHKDGYVLPTNTSLVTTSYYNTSGSAKPVKLKWGVKIEVDLSRDFSEIAAGRPPFTQVLGIKRECVYWNETLTEWSGQGCKLEYEVDGEVMRCNCNHTSTFATLLSLEKIEIPKWATWTSIVLQSISIVFLCLTIVLLSIARARSRGLDSAAMPSCSAQTRNNRTATQISLCTSLICLHATTLMASSAINNDVACYTVAVLQHIFLLSSALWLLNEGAAIMLKMDFALQLNFRILTAVQILVAWVVPVTLVSVTVAVYGRSYIASTPVTKVLKGKNPEALQNYTGGKDFPEFNRCWLNRDNHALLTAFVPTALIVFANAVVIVRLITMVIRMQTQDNRRQGRVGATRRHSQSNAMFMTMFKSHCVLLPVSVLPWLFWLLTDVSTALVGVHTIINGVQGIGIFFIFCVFSEEDRKRLLRLWNRSWLKSLLTPASKSGFPAARRNTRNLVPPRSPREFDALNQKTGTNRSTRLSSSRGSNVTVTTNVL